MDEVKNQRPRPPLADAKIAGHVYLPASRDGKGGTMTSMQNSISSIRWKFIIVVLTISIAEVFLFARLGHYSLWADEAIMALTAKGVMATGDTSVLQEHGNIVAYANGALLRDLHDRMSPPLCTYLTAGSFAIFGVNPWAARLPSVLLGLATIALILYWARKQPVPVMAMLALGLVCNVPLLLSIRQCRYYAPAMFFSTLTVFLYSRWRGGWRGLAALAVPGIFLWASNYMLGAILGVCLVADWLLWRRREAPLTLNCLPVLTVAVLCCGALLWVWNPWRVGAWQAFGPHNGFIDKLRLLWWYFRDLNVCEYYSALALLAAVPLAFFDKTIRRFGLALVLYIIMLGLASQQNLRMTYVADVRYATPLIPLAVALTVAVIWKLTRKKAWLALPLSAALFFTNLGNFGMGGGLLPSGVRSTIFKFARELVKPVPEPFGPTAEWINKNIPDGATVYVANGLDGPIPLMFAAPRALYAWQLTASRRSEPQFASLPAVHFKGGGVMPEYMIGFGPYAQQLKKTYCSPDAAVRYKQIAWIDVPWKDYYRPELLWHRFEAIANFNRKTEAVYIWKKESIQAAKPKDGKITYTANDLVCREADNKIILECGTTDPHIILTLGKPTKLNQSDQTTYLSITYMCDTDGTFRVSIDDGTGKYTDKFVDAPCKVTGDTHVKIRIPVYVPQEGLGINQLHLKPPKGSIFTLINFHFENSP